jgi:transcriptional regulator with XRE-family HTH domain
MPHGYCLAKQMQTVKPRTLSERKKSPVSYAMILQRNLTALLNERQYSRSDLAKRAKLSASFVGDITDGRGNPSLKSIAQIALAIGVPLPWLLMEHPVPTARLPEEHERVVAVLPRHQAFLVRRWIESSQQKSANPSTTEPPSSHRPTTKTRRTK